MGLKRVEVVQQEAGERRLREFQRQHFVDFDQLLSDIQIIIDQANRRGCFAVQYFVPAVKLGSRTIGSPSELLESILFQLRQHGYSASVSPLSDSILHIAWSPPQLPNPFIQPASSNAASSNAASSNTRPSAPAASFHKSEQMMDTTERYAVARKETSPVGGPIQHYIPSERGGDGGGTSMMMMTATSTDPSHLTMQQPISIENGIVRNGPNTAPMIKPAPLRVAATSTSSSSSVATSAAAAPKGREWLHDKLSKWKTRSNRSRTPSPLRP